MAGAESEIRHAAVALLARREHGYQELLRKLLVRGYDGALCQAVLDGLVERDLLSDQRYAEAMVRVRSQKGYGPERIRQELREKGLASTLISEALNDVEVDWFVLAREARNKRFGPQPPADFAERAKQMRFLQYRGFTQEQIRFASEDRGDTE